MNIVRISQDIAILFQKLPIRPVFVDDRLEGREPEFQIDIIFDGERGEIESIFSREERKAESLFDLLSVPPHSQYMEDRSHKQSHEPEPFRSRDDEEIDIRRVGLRGIHGEAIADRQKFQSRYPRNGLGISSGLLEKPPLILGRALLDRHECCELLQERLHDVYF